MERKQWEELRLCDDFMFGIIMRNPEICRLVLERILDIQIERVEYPEEQKEIRIMRDAKSVRLDVYTKDNNDVVYNVEVQTTNPGNLAKRSRYYQGMIDLNLIQRGEDYSKLNRSYIIFICTFDPFGKGRHCYTFEGRCLEDRTLGLLDEATRIFLNTKGTMDDVSGPVKRFLKFLDSASDPEADPDDELQVKMKEAYAEAKESEEWRREYMTLFMELKRSRAEGVEEGRKEAMSLVVCNMLKMGKSLEQIAEETGLPLEEVQKVAVKESI